MIVYSCLLVNTHTYQLTCTPLIVYHAYTMKDELTKDIDELVRIKGKVDALQTITQAQIARKHGITRQAISQHIKRREKQTAK